MTGLLLTDLNFQGMDNNGLVVPYGQLHITNFFTGYLENSWQDSLLTIPNTNPIILSPSGKAKIYLRYGVYNLTLKDKDGAVIWTLNRFISSILDNEGLVDAAANTAINAAYAEAAVVLTRDYAVKTDGFVGLTTDNSAKSWASGGTGNGQPLLGDAKSWAISATSPDGTASKSAKTSADEAAANAALSFQYLATLPVGSVNDSIISSITTWSSAKILAMRDYLGSPIASSSTTNIGATGSGTTIHITGNTTINSFGVSTTGAKITLVFDGSLTITHNPTSLILPASKNIITSSGDVMEVICEDGALGYWRCTSYMVKSVSAEAISYLANVTSDIQAQLNNSINTQTYFIGGF